MSPMTLAVRAPKNLQTLNFIYLITPTLCSCPCCEKQHIITLQLEKLGRQRKTLQRTVSHVLAVWWVFVAYGRELYQSTAVTDPNDIKKAALTVRRLINYGSRPMVENRLGELSFVHVTGYGFMSGVDSVRY